jgi:hypothetical protein
VDGNKQADDTAVIQAAIDSGKTTVFLAGDLYQVDGTIRVRGNVRRLTLGRSVFFRSKRGNPDPLFIIETGNHPVTVIEQIEGSPGGGDFIPTFFLNSSDKTVVLRDMLYGGRNTTVYRNDGSGDLFIEAIGTGGGPFIFKNQRVWARFLNPEYSTPQIINDGGQLWVLGFKFEGGSPGFVGLNGSKTEVLGGLLTCPAEQVALPARWSSTTTPRCRSPAPKISSAQPSWCANFRMDSNAVWRAARCGRRAATARTSSTWRSIAAAPLPPWRLIQQPSAFALRIAAAQRTAIRSHLKSRERAPQHNR